MNAIILAAGLGSRFKELTQTTHKAMLKINNTPNIERTILFLKEAKIDEIIVVVGHLKEQFNCLEKYGVKLVFNKHYASYNSIYSFYKASKYFNESFVIDCDVVLGENIFLQTPQHSTYFCINRHEKGEWYVKEKNGFIDLIETEKKEGLALLGVSFFKKNECKIIKNNLKNYLSPEKLNEKKLYWDNIVLECLSELKIKAKEVKNCYEMDNLSEYEEILEKCKR